MQRGPGRGRLPDHQSPEQPSEKVRQSSASQRPCDGGPDPFALPAPNGRRCGRAEGPWRVPLGEPRLPPAPFVQTSWARR